ncbi:MAG: tetratricopeptide repeat protein [Candidatus Hinthialibacter antarcticus]|nr:tetratricopeptide repeat protein [Candidatus Hinthialibacter antarcticus]
MALHCCAALLAALAMCAVASAQNAAGEAVLSASQQARIEQQDLDFADGLYQRGMFESAARHYEEFIDKHSQSSNRELAMFRQAESLYQHATKILDGDPLNGNLFYIDARSILQALIEEFPNGAKRFDARMRLGEIGYKIGDAEGGLPHLEYVVKEAKEPTVIESALFYAARCYDRLGQNPKAETNYKRIREQYRKGAFGAFASFLLGELLSKQDRLDEAVPVLNHLWQNQNDYQIPEGSGLIGDAQLLAAQLLYKQDRYTEAANAYRAFAESSPDGSQKARAQYGAAWAEYQQQNYPAALTIAAQLKRQFLPADMVPGILFLQGACSYQKKTYQDAISYFRETIANPDAGEYRDRAWYQLAWSYYLAGDYSQTEVECRNLLRIGSTPDVAAKLHFLLGQAYAQQEKYETAAEELMKVELLDPASDFCEDALYLLADLLYRAEQYSRASHEFARYYKKYPDSERTRQSLVWATNAAFAAKDYANAIDLAEQLMRTYPDIPSLHDLLYRKALAQYHLKQLDDALDTLLMLSQSDRSEERKPEALYWQAYIYEMKQNLTRASSVYGELLERYPQFGNNDEVRLRKAFCDYQDEKFDEAYDGFRLLLDSPKQKDVPVEIGFWMIVYADEAERHEDALQVAEALLKIHQKDDVQERARIAQGNQLIALQKWAQAKLSAEAFLKTFPDSLFKPEIHWVLAKALEGLGESDKAAQYFEESLLQLQAMANPDPDFEAKIYVDMGRVLDSQNKRKEALDAFLRVAILFDHPRLTPEAMYRAIRCHLADEQTSEAATLMDELVEKYPDSQWGRRAREEFQSLAQPAP